MNTEQGVKEQGMPTTKAVSCREMVSYQDGAVVSRVLLRRESGNVTLFAFDAGQGLSEHTSPYDALVYLLEGEAEITISSQKLNAKAGEIVLMPAQQPHALKAVTAFKMLLIMMRS